MGGIHATIVLLLVLPCCHSLNTFFMPYPCSNGVKRLIDVGSPYTGLNSTGVLKLKHMFYEPNMNCSILLKSNSSDGITVVIRELDFRTSCQDNLTIRWSDGSGSRLCGTEMKDLLSYSGKGPVSIEFRSGPGAIGSRKGFEMIFTSNTDSPCRNDSVLFQCENKLCISSLLRCDGHNHCGDRSDQRHCHKHKRRGMAVKIGIMLGFAVFIVIVLSFFVFMRRRRRNILYASETISTVTKTTYNPYLFPPASTAHYPPVATAYPPPESYQPPPLPYHKVSGGYK